MKRVLFATASIAQLACLDSVVMRLPEDLGASAILLADGDPSAIVLIEPRQLALPINVPDEGSLLLSYDRSLVGLGITLPKDELPAFVAIVDERPLPPPTDVRRWNGAEWTPAGDIGALSDRRLLAFFDWEQCWRLGGCAARDGSGRSCRPDCAPPDPLAPSPPALPEPPSVCTEWAPEGPTCVPSIGCPSISVSTTLMPGETVAELLARTPEGGTAGLPAGTHTSSVAIVDRTLVGLCEGGLVTLEGWVGLFGRSGLAGLEIDGYVDVKGHGTLEDVVLRGGQTVLYADGVGLDAKRLVAFGAVTASVSDSIRLEDIFVRGDSDSALCLSAATSSVSRAYVEASGAHDRPFAHTFLLHTGDADLQDLTIVQRTDDWTGFVTGLGSLVVADRVRVIGGAGGGVITGSAELRDVVVAGPDRQGLAIGEIARADVTIERAHLSGRMDSRGIKTDHRSTVELVDVFVEDFETGIRIEEGEGRLTRVAIERSRLYGLHVGEEFTPNFFASDLRILGAGDSGLFMDRNEAGRVERFRIECVGGAGAGISLESPDYAHGEGTVVGCDVAISAPLRFEDSVLLDGVRFEGNRQVIEAKPSERP